MHKLAEFFEKNMVAISYVCMSMYPSDSDYMYFVENK